MVFMAAKEELIKSWRIWFLIFVIVLAAFLMVFNGINFGIDFEGGTMFQIHLAEKVQNIEERVRNIEKLTDDIDTHGRIIRKLTDDVIRIEDMVSEAKERIGDLEDTVESMGERIDCMENDMEYVKDNMMEGEDTYNPPDDYMF